MRNLSFSDQKAVISYISDVLKSKGYVDEDFKKTLLEREATDNTCFHNLVAIPHATLASVKKNVIYILLNDRPIRWGNREANLVILVAMEHDLIPDFRLFYKTLVKIMACSDNMDSLLKTYTYGEFLNAIQGMQDL